MRKVYTTQELIEILARERQACMRGQRLSLTAKASGNPIVDRFLSTEGIQKFTAYQNFRATVHQYQRDRGVSGLVWRQVAVGDRRLSFPMTDDQLVALPSDLATLRAAKASVLQFWYAVTPGLDIFLSLDRGRDYRLIDPAEVDGMAQRVEWAGVAKQERSDFLEIVLQLGWGQPDEARYRRGWPESGSEYVHAVVPGQRPIC